VCHSSSGARFGAFLLFPASAAQKPATVIPRTPSFPALRAKGHRPTGTGRFVGKAPKQSAQEALKLDPNSANVWFNLGLALDESGERSEAEVAYRRAVQILPDLVPALTRLARLYTATGRAADARPLWVQIVQLAPSSDAGREAQASLNAP
jgi:cytochrome c-type biogenesis protein CcmH/NrfG